MEKFSFNLSTTIHFGKGSVSDKLGESLLKYGKKVLLVYDEIPVKKSGLYDEIVQVFNDNQIDFVELTGIEPNPRHTTVNKGIDIARTNNVDCVIGAGGGSTIDTAKAIGFGFYYDCDVWELFEKKENVKYSLPVIAIPTLAASGAEVSNSSIISNIEKKRKTGVKSDIVRPDVAIMDPTFTFTVPKFHTACGIIDIMSHTYESYLSNDFGEVQDGISESIQKSCITNGLKVMDNPCDFNARGQLMWCSSLSISMISSLGRSSRFASVHNIEHLLSAYFDIPHGSGIAIVTIGWLKYCTKFDECIPKLAQWGRNVFNVKNINDNYVAIKMPDVYEEFVKKLGLPVKLSHFGISEKDIYNLVNKEFLRLKNTDQWFAPVNDESDLIEILSYVL